MLLDLFLLALGGGLLYFGAEWLVRGAAGSALKLGVRPLLIGLTIVSYATSAPELAVSVSSALQKNSEIALGNVIGSNIANIALILGVSSLIAPPKSDGSMRKKELVIVALATVALPLVLLDGSIGWIDGSLFLLGSVGFTTLTIRWSRSRTVSPNDLPAEGEQSLLKLIAVGLLGLAVLMGGGEVFVRASARIAHAVGVSDLVIGLTVVAFGTSVPELAASVVAALRGHSDLALGNVIGSNIFNLLLILGAAGVLHPIEANLGAMKLDFGFLFGLTAFAILVLSFQRRITRLEGALLTASYVSYIALLVIMAK